jgi:primase-polymerase (primpol)-like protein
MTPTLKQLDELEKKAAQTEEYLNSLGRSDGDYHTKAHDDAADDAWIARRNFERALIDFWRSEEGRQMREDAERYRWLRSNADEVYCGEPEIEWYVKDGRLPAQLDDAIDAARGEDK